jgi:hypothetical protein
MLTPGPSPCRAASRCPPESPPRSCRGSMTSYPPVVHCHLTALAATFAELTTPRWPRHTVTGLAALGRFTILDTETLSRPPHRSKKCGVAPMRRAAHQLDRCAPMPYPGTDLTFGAPHGVHPPRGTVQEPRLFRHVNCRLLTPSQPARISQIAAVADVAFWDIADISLDPGCRFA